MPCPASAAVILPLAMSSALLTGLFAAPPSEPPVDQPAVVAISAPDPSLVPPEDLPAGLHLDELSVPDVTSFDPAAVLADPGGAAQTLYRDASGERVLVAARTTSSDTGGGFAGAYDGQLVELHDGREAALIENGPLTIVAWDESDADDCDVCYQTGLVAARGLTSEEVLAAASAAQVREPAPVVGDEALPESLDAISVVPLLDPFENLDVVSERFALSDADGNEMLVFAYGGGGVVAEHLSFWIDDGRHLGALVGTDATIRTVDDTVVLAVSVGIPAETVRQFVDGLRPGDATDVAAAVAEVQQAPVTAADSCLDSDIDPAHTAVLGGTTADGARWIFGFGIDPHDGEVTTCHRIQVDGEPFGGGASSGDRFDVSADPATIAVARTGVSAGDRGWWIAYGTVTDRAERVVATFADTEQAEAELADVGPADGWRWFAIGVPATADGDAAVSAVAYDTSGEEIATGSSR
jgi:hypothetical protein